jgi:SAM-dependent methyltransferase
MPPDPHTDLAGHPDRLRWNARYAAREATFTPHPLAVAALALPLPDLALPDRALPGLPVLELASGPSGSALLAAELGHRVTAVDVSDVGLDQLADEAGRRGLSAVVTVVQADVTTWTPARACYGLVLCIGFWDEDAFRGAAAAVAPGGLLAWEGLTAQARDRRPELPAAWCLGPGEPAALLPASFAVLEQEDLPGHGGLPRRRMLARNSAET